MCVCAYDCVVVRRAGYHGTTGPMKITDLKLTPLVQAFLDAGRELSYDVLDVNGASQLGESLSLLGLERYRACHLVTNIQ